MLQTPRIAQSRSHDAGDVRDDAGNQAADVLAQKLTTQGIACHRIQFPKGMDANEYALKMTPPGKALALLIRKAEWMGEGRAPVPLSASVADPVASSLAAGVEAEPPAPPVSAR